MSDLLIRLFGWRAALVHGDTTVLDRWRFLRCHLPRVRGAGDRVLEVGCGTGAFTMGAASRGYEAVGLSWDERNQTVANRRAELAGLKKISFPIVDARRLDEHTEFVGGFDVVVCFEVVEHIIDDRKLFRDIYRCLKPGGRLYLTTPNYYYRASDKDMGPFSVVEDGWHVRRGYSPAMLRELCADSGFEVEEISYVSYFFSQLGWRAQTWLAHSAFGRLLGNGPQWLITAPLRIAPILLDGWLGRWISYAFDWPGYSITLTAYRRRFETAAAAKFDSDR